MVGVDEGMNGISMCFVFKVLVEIFNYDIYEVVVDLVYLMYILE